MKLELGCVVGHKVIDISHDGSLREWNEENLSQAVAVGDRIISISGKTNYDEAVQDMTTSTTIVIMLRKANADICEHYARVWRPWKMYGTNIPPTLWIGKYKIPKRPCLELWGNKRVFQPLTS